MASPTDELLIRDRNPFIFQRIRARARSGLPRPPVLSSGSANASARSVKDDLSDTPRAATHALRRDATDAKIHSQPPDAHFHMLTTSPAARRTTSPPADGRTTNSVAPAPGKPSTSSAPTAAPTAKSSVIAAQEQQLRAKYGNAIPNRGSAAARLRSARDRRKYFDSGDYALAKAAGRPADAAAGIPLVGPGQVAPQPLVKAAVAGGASPPRGTAPPVAPAGNPAVSAKAQVQAAP
ncbi:hypothetical protein GGF31_000236 [Allomyces arbusculus]|nr:hypothetical protein GGF31_000236 [Allomyces arbusculus]